MALCVYSRKAMGQQVVTLQDVAEKSYLHDLDLSRSLGVKFSCVELRADGITGMERINNELLTIQDSRLTLQQDETFYGELTLSSTYLDCNGYRLHTGGALTQKDSIVNLDRGALHVDKDYHITGNSILQMIRYEDRVYVGGTFATASSYNHSSMLRAGRMEVMGNFDQSGDPNSFTSTELFTMAFLGSGTHQAHFMEKKAWNKYFANLDPYYNDVEYVTDSISATTAAIHIGIGMAEGLAEAFLDSAMAVIAGIFLALYGISAVVVTVDTLVKVAEIVTLIITVLSVYSMLKAGDELGDALNGDYSEKKKAELFGKAAVMMILAAGGLYGSLNAILQPGMLRSIVMESKSAIGQTFADMKSLVQISYIQDVDSMLLYCEEFVSGPALRTLREAVKGCNVKQLHDMAKMIRRANKEIKRALTGDELAAALSNWQETGSATKSVQIVVDLVKWKGNSLVSITKERLQHSVLGDFNSNGRLVNGGHGQANMDYLIKNNIEYNIVKTYENGVRVGNIPSHKNKFKRTGVGQAWFPEGWTDIDIKKAGEYVANIVENIDKPDGTWIFGEYNGVRVGIIKKDGQIGTIIPDNSIQP